MTLPTQQDIGATIRLAARLRALLCLSTDDLAAVLGVNARTVTRAETWSGPVLTAVQLLGETARGRVGPVLSGLLELHARRAADPADPASVARLVARAEAGLEEVMPYPSQGSLLEACAAPLSWIYWATSARADEAKTRQLADQEGVIIRPLLQQGTRGSSELHGYLLALQPDDLVLLCHDAAPVAWYALRQHVEPMLGEAARVRLRRTESEDRIDLADALPQVFQRIAATSPLGQQFGPLGYRLFDGAKPKHPGLDTWYSALAVVPSGERELPTPKEFSRRPPGDRARMTRFRRPSPLHAL